MNRYEVKNYHNYLWCKKLNLPTDIILSSCRGMHECVHRNFKEVKANIYEKFSDIDQSDNVNPNQNVPFSTLQYYAYNLFMYPAPGFYELFVQIRDAYREFSNDDQPAYMEAWLNVYNRGDHLDWHGHWPPEYEIWHGFYCVDVETDSYTDYRIPMVREEVRVHSEDNLLVIGKGTGDLHRSSPWHLDHKPRVTIAFDIIPQKSLQPFNAINHWIPV